jgi:hypothetical protein
VSAGTYLDLASAKVGDTGLVDVVLSDGRPARVTAYVSARRRDGAVVLKLVGGGEYRYRVRMPEEAPP